MRKPPFGKHPIAIGPVHLTKKLGARIRLGNGLDLTLAHCEGATALFWANPAGLLPQLWTSHEDRPGLYIRVGECPRGPNAVFDVKEAIKRARIAQLIAEALFDLDHWSHAIDEK